MKLSNDFTLFGLNIKAIQSHLKEQAKDQRGIRVTRRGDLVYIMTPHTAFKLPAMLYPDIIQPVTLRECPADGVTIVSAQYGFEVDEHAPDLVDIFKSAACKEKTVQRTPFLQDIPTGKKKSDLARLFHVGPVPILVNAIYDSMANPAQFTYYGKTSGYAPVYAVCASDPTIAMVMCPIKPTEEVEALCKKMFSE